MSDLFHDTQQARNGKLVTYNISSFIRFVPNRGQKMDNGCCKRIYTCLFMVSFMFSLLSDYYCVLSEGHLSILKLSTKRVEYCFHGNFYK